MIRHYLAYRKCLHIAHELYPHKKIQPSHSVKRLHDGFVVHDDVHIAMLEFSIPGDRSGKSCSVYI